MLTNERLEELRAVAKRCPQQEWQARFDNIEAAVSSQRNGRIVVPSERSEYGCVRTVLTGNASGDVGQYWVQADRADLEHIAAFDPPTALALVEMAQGAFEADVLLIRAAAAVSMAKAYIESGRADDALSVLKTLDRDASRCRPLRGNYDKERRTTQPDAGGDGRREGYGFGHGASSTDAVARPVAHPRKRNHPAH